MNDQLTEEEINAVHTTNDKGDDKLSTSICYGIVKGMLLLFLIFMIMSFAMGFIYGIFEPQFNKMFFTVLN